MCERCVIIIPLLPLLLLLLLLLHFFVIVVCFTMLLPLLLAAADRAARLRDGIYIQPSICWHPLSCLWLLVRDVTRRVPVLNGYPLILGGKIPGCSRVFMAVWGGYLGTRITSGYPQDIISHQVQFTAK